MKRRTEITIQVDEVIVNVAPRPPARAWCPTCGTEVSLVPIAEVIDVSPAGVNAPERTKP